jgi:hypothetical protein
VSTHDTAARDKCNGFDILRLADFIEVEAENRQLAFAIAHPATRQRVVQNCVRQQLDRFLSLRRG